ncbi:hypothetical protein [Brevibacillus panacihumi]|uniref:hypothetical protein n=1 Tax=Brevibacillus panacihumi TaxID=497735 RepID=UPI003D1F3DB5
MNQDPREQNANEHFARFGGVHFRSHVPPQQINRFIGRLPAGKRDSMFEVLDQLEQAGLITVCNDQVFADGNGVVGGGEEKGQNIT